MLIKGSTTINFRFDWGHMESGVWTPNALPSIVLTFVDSKAGNTTCAAETVSTSDATRYTAGASITVVETESGVSFTKHVRSEYTASPTSRILTEQQLFSSGSMEFENKGTLHRHVSDRWSKKPEEFLHRDDEFELAGAGGMSSYTSFYTCYALRGKSQRWE